MYCGRCGNYVGNSSKFCGYCGALLNNDRNNSNISLILGIAAIIMLSVPFVSIPMAIASIVMGKRNKDSGKSGIVLGIVSLVISVIYMVLIIGFCIFAVIRINYYFNDYEWDNDYYIEDEVFDLSGHSYDVSDGGLLYLNENMQYVWYEDKADSTSYYNGTYEFYNGIEAVNYIVDNYGISQVEQWKSFDCWKEDSNYYLIIFDCTNMIVNGKVRDSNDISAYYGFYSDFGDYFSLINIDSSDRIEFRLINEVFDNTI